MLMYNFLKTKLLNNREKNIVKGKISFEMNLGALINHVQVKIFNEIRRKKNEKKRL